MTGLARVSADVALVDVGAHQAYIGKLTTKASRTTKTSHLVNASRVYLGMRSGIDGPYTVATRVDDVAADSVAWWAVPLSRMIAFNMVVDGLCEMYRPDDPQDHKGLYTSRGISTATAYAWRTAVRGAIAKAVKLGLVADATLLLDALPATKQRSETKPPLDDNIVAVLLAASPTRPVELRDIGIVITSLFTGVRGGELASLTVGQVSASSHGAKRTKVVGKGTKTRSIVVPEELQARLVAWRRCFPTGSKPSDPLWVKCTTGTGEIVIGVDGRPIALSEARVKAAGIEAARRLGIPSIALHALRRTWATTALDAGVSVLALQRMGGWANAQTVERYAHVAIGRQADAGFEAVAAKLGGKL
jgi:integrase/recombinase XerC